MPKRRASTPSEERPFDIFCNLPHADISLLGRRFNSMPKESQRMKSVALRKPVAARTSEQSAFDEVVRLIAASRARALAAVNTELIDLYWSIGEHISRRIAADGWSKNTVEALADYVQRVHPDRTGFSARNLWRMRQFYEIYRDQPELAPLVRELSWSHNLLIMSHCRWPEEREFYLRVSERERWTYRELQRQINGALFERAVLTPPKLSTVLAELHPQAAEIFKDSYLLDFLDLPPQHGEADLQRGLVEQLKCFLIELGRDFCYVGSQYPLRSCKPNCASSTNWRNRKRCCRSTIMSRATAP